jgi:putative ABC transport system permease protein
MNLWESLRIAVRALGRNMLRTGLTMLGIIIGVAAVITMLALGQGAQQRVTESISSLGTNLITVMPGSGRVRFGPPGIEGAATITLKEADAEAIARRFPDSVAAVAPTARGSATAKLGDVTYQTSLIGVTPEYRSVSNTPVSLGRFITQGDVDGRLKVVVLGPTVVGQLLGSPTADPVGMTIQINRIAFKVVGVLKTKGSGAFGQDQDDVVLVPLSTALRRVLNRDYVSSIAIEARSRDTIDLATEQVSRLLRQRHHLLPPFPDNDDFVIRSQSGLLEAFQTATQSMTSLLAGIAVVSLIVGGIGIMNIMLVSVSERTREIGLRKAVGATSRDVLLQFIIESCVIAIAGGVLGVAMGALGSSVLGRILNTSTIMTVRSIVLAVAVSSAVGLLFGVYPARKAAQLDPINALRYE